MNLSKLCFNYETSKPTWAEKGQRMAYHCIDNESGRVTGKGRALPRGQVRVGWSHLASRALPLKDNWGAHDPHPSSTPHNHRGSWPPTTGWALCSSPPHLLPTRPPVSPGASRETHRHTHRGVLGQVYKFLATFRKSSCSPHPPPPSSARPLLFGGCLVTHKARQILWGNFQCLLGSCPSYQKSVRKPGKVRVSATLWLQSDSWSL